MAATPQHLSDARRLREGETSMTLLQRLGLRWRMFVFGAVALLPILGLMGYHAWEETDTKIGQERIAAGNLVAMVAAEQALRFDLGRQLQAALALNPAITDPRDRAACHRVLEQAVAGEQYLSGMSLFSASGEPVCSSAAKLPPPIADREYFKEVLRQKQYIVSDYMNSRRTGRAVVALATPLLDEARNVRHVLVAGLDIAWLARALEKTPVPADTNLVVVDGKGTVLAPEKWLGKSIADHPVFQRITGSAGQLTFEGKGIDGIERIFVARPLQSTLGGNIYVWAAVNKAEVVQAAIREFLAGSILFFLLAIAFYILIWRTGSRAVLKPIELLKTAAGRLGGTDLKARTELPHGADEIGQLATSFDDMAEAIEHRETDLLLSKESLLRANRALRVLSAGNHAVVRATDAASLLAEMCRVAVAEGGYKSAWIGRAERDAECSVSILASAGMAEDYLRQLNVSWANTERGRGPAGTTIRENRPFAVHSVEANSRFAPWRELAVKHGYKAVFGLPVSVEGAVWGVLCIYADQADAFDEEEMRLLGEMAMDLGFGIETLRLREKEAATREALQRSNEDLEERVAARTAALAQSNRELEAFSYSASHDLRAPLRSIAGFAEIVHEDYGHLLDAEGRSHLDRIRRAAIRMGQLIDDLLQLARVSQAEVNKVPVILSELARDVFAEVASATPGRSVKVGIEEGLAAEGDPVLLRVALQNLLENAWKYSGQRADAEIAFGALALPDGQLAYFVRDNGSGFDMAQAGRLFQPFVRLHGGEEYPGTGIGLATVARVIERHGGRIWAEAEKDKGATFFFTLD
jgi:signal transduction histidine kinase